MKTQNKKSLLILLSIIIGVFLIILISAANNPVGPDTLNITSNTTKSTAGATMVNISGGYVASINITATVQDTRWKAFVGRVSGAFSLQDSTGSTVYNWALTSITGRIYATRNSTTVSWANVNCSNITTLNQENINMNHSNANDNLNMTFNYSTGATHKSFYVGSRLMVNNTCPTLNTFKNNASQDTNFEEMALYDGYNVFYATILDPSQIGYNAQTYDFQMIVPENGAASFQGATAYYLYVELGT